MVVVSQERARVREKLVPIVLVLVVVGGIAGGVKAGLFALPGTDDSVPRPDRIDTIHYGPVFSKPHRYQQKLLRDPSVATIRIGSSTFGKLLTSQARFSIEGSGPMVNRSVTADTVPAHQMLSDASQEHTLVFIHGVQRLLDQRQGYIRGISFSKSLDGFAANSLVIYVERGEIDGNMDRIVQFLFRIARDPNTLAWYQFHSSWIVIGPELSRPLLKTLNDPTSTTPQQQLRIAYVLRHEIEHSVSSSDWSYDNWDQVARLRWMEESSSDTIARWPGVAAATAHELGLRYPQAADTRSYDSFSTDKRGVSGYDDIVAVMRGLLALAGLDTHSAADYRKAADLIQDGTVEHLPQRLAAAIVEHQHLRSSDRAWLVRSINALNGEQHRFASLKHGIKLRQRAR
jgi:hypothetical protein